LKKTVLNEEKKDILKEQLKFGYISVEKKKFFLNLKTKERKKEVKKNMFFFFLQIFLTINKIRDFKIWIFQKFNVQILIFS